jgi:hypothetical protein
MKSLTFSFLLVTLASSWSPTQLSRRQALIQGTAVTTGALFAPLISNGLPTEETPRVSTRMGGLLEPFQDGPRSIKMLAPSGWNKFEGEVGAYDVRVFLLHFTFVPRL